MAKATIREDGRVLAEVIRDEWQEVSEELGSEIHQILISDRPESLTIGFDGYARSEWEELDAATRHAIEEVGPE
jgi:hypothetical protein